jgi:hypothetical protein
MLNPTGQAQKMLNGSGSKNGQTPCRAIMHFDEYNSQGHKKRAMMLAIGAVTTAGGVTDSTQRTRPPSLRKLNLGRGRLGDADPHGETGRGEDRERGDPPGDRWAGSGRPGEGGSPRVTGGSALQRKTAEYCLPRAPRPNTTPASFLENPNGQCGRGGVVHKQRTVATSIEVADKGNGQRSSRCTTCNPPLQNRAQLAKVAGAKANQRVRAPWLGTRRTKPNNFQPKGLYGRWNFERTCWSWVWPGGPGREV